MRRKVYLRKLNFCVVVFIGIILFLPNIAGCTDWRKTRPGPAERIIVKTNQPYSFMDLKNDLHQLERSYPKQLTVGPYGKSIMGRELFLVTLGSGKRKILVTAGIHGREWLTSLLAAKIIEEYARAAANRRPIGKYDLHRLLRENTLMFVPMANPDGVEIALKGLRAGGDSGFLKLANEGNHDFSAWKANARGVNLNIQFSANWNKALSLGKPHFEKYKGIKPESEPESRALADLVRNRRPAALVCYHSSGEVVYWFYGQTGPELRRDLNLARGISGLTGYRLAREPRHESHGGFKDWFIYRFKRPGFTIELGKPVNDRPVSLSEFSRIWRQNKKTPLYLLNEFER